MRCLQIPVQVEMEMQYPVEGTPGGMRDEYYNLNGVCLSIIKYNV